MMSWSFIAWIIASDCSQEQKYDLCKKSSGKSNWKFYIQEKEYVLAFHDAEVSYSTFKRNPSAFETLLSLDVVIYLESQHLRDYTCTVQNVFQYKCAGIKTTKDLKIVNSLLFHCMMRWLLSLILFLTIVRVFDWMYKLLCWL